MPVRGSIKTSSCSSPAGGVADFVLSRHEKIRDKNPLLLLLLDLGEAPPLLPLLLLVLSHGAIRAFPVCDDPARPADMFSGVRGTCIIE